jgi:hypothetical protein
MPRYLELAAADPVIGDGRGPAGPSLPQRGLIDWKVTMSKLRRALLLGATLAAMNLAGMTTVAQANATDEAAIARHHAVGQVKFPVAGGHGAPWPPLERQVGESYRHRQVAPESQTTTDPAAQRALARQRY